jgi:hypothetical protein
MVPDPDVLGDTTIEDKMSEYITKSVAEHTDKLMMDILADEPKESTGPSAQ